MGLRQLVVRLLLVAGIALFAWGLDFVIASATDRTPPDVVLTICRATGGSGSLYSPLDVHVARDGSVAGEAEHKQDVIPPYTYAGVAEPGQNWTVQGRALWYRGCGSPGAPASPGTHSVASTAGAAQSQASNAVPELPVAQPSPKTVDAGEDVVTRVSGIYMMVIGLLVSIAAVIGHSRLA